MLKSIGLNLVNPAGYLILRSFLTAVCCVLLILSLFSQSVRVPSVTLLMKIPRATMTSLWIVTSQDTTTCHRSADPLLLGEHLSDSCISRTSLFPFPQFERMVSGLCSQRKEQTLCSALTVRARTTHTDTEPCVPLRNYCLLWMRPFPTQHCPSVGQSGTYLTVTDLSSRLGSQRAAVRKAGLWRRQWGFFCIYLPWEKNAIKTFAV